MMVGALLFAIIPVLIFLPGLIAGFIAWSKGYRPWFWLVSMGPIGTVVIALIPGLAQAATPEERERMESRADWTGGILSGFTMAPLFGLPLLGAFAFLSFRSVAVPPPAVITATPATVVDEFVIAAPMETDGPADADQPENTPTEQ